MGRQGGLSEAKRIWSRLLEPVSAYSRTDRTCEEKESAPFPSLAAVSYHVLIDGY